MKNRINTIALAAMTVAATLFAACGKNVDPIEPEKDPEITVTLNSVIEATYHGNANRNELGLYTVTFQAEGHRLSLELSSSLTEEIDPVPDEGTYTFSIDDQKNTFNNNSTWFSEDENGTETNRKLASGSFTWQPSTAGYKLAGSVVGRDGAKLIFSYEGAIEFENLNSKPAEDAITCLGAYGTYYGKYYIPNAADYYLVLYDTKHSSSGDPYNYRICLDFTSAAPAGSLLPAMGTYRVDSEGLFAEGTFVPGMLDGESGTLWQVPSGGGSSRIIVSDGFFTIRKNDNGGYQIFGTLKDNYGEELSFSYEGNLSFANEAGGKLTSLTSDFALDEAFYANQKCYSTSEYGNMWKLFFYDEASWVSKGSDGYFVSFDIVLPTDVKAIPAGEYNVADHVLLPGMGEFIEGYIFAAESASAAAYGSWLVKGTTPYAPISGGKLNLVKNTDNTFTATFDALDDDYSPKHITGSFTGEIPLTADSKVSGNL